MGWHVSVVTTILLAPFVDVDVAPDVEVEMVGTLGLGTGVGSTVGAELVGDEFLELGVRPEKLVLCVARGVGVVQEHLGTEDSIIDAVDVDLDGGVVGLKPEFGATFLSSAASLDNLLPISLTTF